MLSIFPADGMGDEEEDAALEHLTGPGFSLPELSEVEIVRETAAP
ncbi:hypothetical protein [Brachybacterium sp. Z12]|nr:hypothetical protein [Brachybacterium sp. Z12]